jgi:hypothetical protein
VNTLAEIYARHLGSDKGTTHSYIEVYEKLLEPWRELPLRMLEIGLYNGDSLRMWEEYFTHGEVWGIDRALRPDKETDLRPMIAEGGHHIAILDATDRTAVAREFGRAEFDIVIEDASHRLEDTLQIYANFHSRFLPTLYIVEDIQNIDRDYETLLRMDPYRRVRILDRRGLKGRYDDVLVILDHE